jgi:protein gp37
MSDNSHIEWTQATWNPVTGCSKISPGCKNCYAERMAWRLKAMGKERYANGFQVAVHDDVLNVPKGWRRPRTIFVNSMSDLFHKFVSTQFIRQVFEVMNECPQHQFQLLTKRTPRLRALANDLPWSENIWIGASVELDKFVSRVDDLRAISQAAVRFLSIEPLLGPLPSLDLSGIDWVIVGGESGPGARPMREEWVLQIKETCEEAGVPFFFKQWGGVNKAKAGRTLLGQTWDAMPITSGGLAKVG